MIRKSKENPKGKTPALRALERAGQNALELARRTGTPCYVMKNGKVVDIAKAGSKRKRRRTP